MGVPIDPIRREAVKSQASFEKGGLREAVGGRLMEFLYYPFKQ